MSSGCGGASTARWHGDPGLAPLRRVRPGIDDSAGEDRRARRWATAHLGLAPGKTPAGLHVKGCAGSPSWAERGGGIADGHGNSVPRVPILGSGPAWSSTGSGYRPAANAHPGDGDGRGSVTPPVRLRCRPSRRCRTGLCTSRTRATRRWLRTASSSLRPPTGHRTPAPPWRHRVR